MKKRAVFLDRDGTIIEDVGYLSSTSELKLIPRAGSAIKSLNEGGFLVIVATNQSGIARGYLTDAELESIHQALRVELAKEGAVVDAIYYCPHYPQDAENPKRKACDCRKPSTKMLEQAALDFKLELGQCYVVGDKLCDIELGSRIGCKTVLVLTGYGELVFKEINQSPGSPMAPTHIATDLANAASWILGDAESIKEEMVANDRRGCLDT